MKTKYRYISFVPAGDGLWLCFNTKAGDVLMIIEYYKPWKQWVSSGTVPDAVFSHDCHTNIAHFLQQLNEKDK